LTPDQFMRAVGVIIEECAHGTRDKVTGDMQPLTRAELVAIRERFETLVALNMPREAKDGRS
jgi:hypothetical protein